MCRRIFPDFCFLKSIYVDILPLFPFIYGHCYHKITQRGTSSITKRFNYKITYLLLGVSKLNMCRADCKWEDEISIDLYPWDAGTDSGLSYFVSISKALKLIYK